jgi:hypothetical protein
MTTPLSGQQREMIFHPLIFGVACAPHPIEKSPWEVILFFVRLNFAQKMDDHVVYFKLFDYIY